MRNAIVATLAVLVAAAASGQLVALRPSTQQFLIPAAGAQAGNGGTFFRSDITIVNYRTADQRIRLQWLPQDVSGGGGAAVEIDHRRDLGHRQRRLRDQRDAEVGTRRDPRHRDRRQRPTGLGRAARRHVAHLDSAAGDGGTTSQSLPSIATIDISSSTVSILGARRDSRYRTNVGIVNLSADVQTFQVVVFGSSGTDVRQIDVQPMSMVLFGVTGAASTHAAADSGAERDHDRVFVKVRGVCIIGRQRHRRCVDDARLEFAGTVSVSNGRVLGFEANPYFGALMRRLFAFASLCLLSASALAIEPPREKERWTTLTIDELTVYSSADDGTTRSVASDLVRLRGALAVVTKLKVRSPLPTRVFIFGDRRSFAQYCDAALGRSDNMTGLFLSDRDGNHVLIAGNAAGVDRVVYHELTHYFLRNTVSSHVPLWFNEGLAEFYSTFTGSKDTVDVGRPIEDHIAWLRTQTLIPLKDLFAITHDSKEYHEGNRQGVFYAESWALVHYLMIGNPERRDQLGTYIGLIASGKSIDDAFHMAFHGSYDDLERELRKYIRAFSMSYIRYTMADLMTVDDSRAAAAAARHATGRAGRSAHAREHPHFAEAESFLNAALKANPSSAEAYAELGVAKSWQRQNAEAEANFDKAVQLGSRDAMPYILYGESILRRVDASVRKTPARRQPNRQSARAFPQGDGAESGFRFRIFRPRRDLHDVAGRRSAAGHRGVGTKLGTRSRPRSTRSST